MSETEQNKTEEPTPFKLKKAREKGQIAKGQDLAFFGALLGLGLFTVLLGPRLFHDLTRMMETSFTISALKTDEPRAAVLAVEAIYRPALRLVLTFGGVVFSLVLLAQIFQNKGLLFTSHPLKPDFTKLNPAKGLKRVFSMRTLKESLKNIFKMCVYLGGTWLVVRYSLELYGPNISDGEKLVKAMFGSAMRLLFMFMALGLIFAAIDQVIVRKEFTKEMRMSKSELKRETKDREGEPRLKQKRKELHREFAKQTGSLGNLEGSDLLLVNPQHYAIGLRYDSATMDAPILTSKGRNRFALLLKARATSLGIPILVNPPLTRAIYKATQPGQPIPPKHFRDVADSYIAVIKRRNENETT